MFYFTIINVIII